MRLISWNLNGIRAAMKKGVGDWMQDYRADMYAFQEVKAQEQQLDESILTIGDYHPYFHPAKRKGYSGVAFYIRGQQPDEVRNGFDARYDDEGRVILARYGNLHFYNVYFPNGQSSPERLAYKMAFYDDFLAHIEAERAQGKDILVCGDYNTAHREIDIARPKENSHTSGFLPVERAWMDALASHGYVDTYRHFHPEDVAYTWWSMRTGARARNVGWRIDYFYVNQEALDHVKSAFILTEVMGSDHCPLGIDWE